MTEAERREIDLVDDGPAEQQDVLVALIRHYERPLYRYLYVLTGQQDSALDCVQEVFLRAHEHLRRGKTVNKQWLYTVGRNRAIDELRRQRREGLNPALLGRLATPGQPGDAVDLQQAFDELSADDRAVLYLDVVEGLPGEEAAALLGIRPAALRMRLLRARERFRTRYGGRR